MNGISIMPKIKLKLNDFSHLIGIFGDFIQAFVQSVQWSHMISN